MWHLQVVFNPNFQIESQFRASVPVELLVVLSMAAFEVLKYNKRFFKVNLFGTFINSIIFINMMILLISYGALIVQHSSDVESISEACLVIIGLLQAVAAYFNIRLKSSQMNIYHSKLQRIINEGVLFLTKLD